MLGWTVSTHLCVNPVGGPLHVPVNHTALQASTTKPAVEVEAKHHDDTKTSPKAPLQLRTISCPSIPKTRKVIFTRPLQNTTKLTCYEKTVNSFTPLKRKSARLNPANGRCCYREQAMSRLHGLLRSFKRRSQMEKDYLEFFGKVIKRGHTVSVPKDELRMMEESETRMKKQHRARALGKCGTFRISGSTTQRNLVRNAFSSLLYANLKDCPSYRLVFS